MVAPPWQPNNTKNNLCQCPRNSHCPGIASVISPPGRSFIAGSDIFLSFFPCRWWDQQEPTRLIHKQRTRRKLQYLAGETHDESIKHWDLVNPKKTPHGLKKKKKKKGTKRQISWFCFVYSSKCTVLEILSCVRSIMTAASKQDYFRTVALYLPNPMAELLWANRPRASTTQ